MASSSRSSPTMSASSNPLDSIPINDLVIPNMTSLLPLPPPSHHNSHNSTLIHQTPSQHSPSLHANGAGFSPRSRPLGASSSTSTSSLPALLQVEQSFLSSQSPHPTSIPTDRQMQHDNDDNTEEDNVIIKINTHNATSQTGLQSQQQQQQQQSLHNNSSSTQQQHHQSTQHIKFTMTDNASDGSAVHQPLQQHHHTQHNDGKVPQGQFSTPTLHGRTHSTHIAGGSSSSHSSSSNTTYQSHNSQPPQQRHLHPSQQEQQQQQQQHSNTTITTTATTNPTLIQVVGSQQQQRNVVTFSTPQAVQSTTFFPQSTTLTTNTHSTKPYSHSQQAKSYENSPQLPAGPFLTKSGTVGYPTTGYGQHGAAQGPYMAQTPQQQTSNQPQQQPHRSSATTSQFRNPPISTPQQQQQLQQQTVVKMTGNSAHNIHSFNQQRQKKQQPSSSQVTFGPNNTNNNPKSFVNKPTMAPESVHSYNNHYGDASASTSGQGYEHNGICTAPGTTALTRASSLSQHPVNTAPSVSFMNHYAPTVVGTAVGSTAISQWGQYKNDELQKKIDELFLQLSSLNRYQNHFNPMTTNVTSTSYQQQNHYNTQEIYNQNKAQSGTHLATIPSPEQNSYQGHTPTKPFSTQQPSPNPYDQRDHHSHHALLTDIQHGSQASSNAQTDPFTEDNNTHLHNTINPTPHHYRTVHRDDFLRYLIQNGIWLDDPRIGQTIGRVQTSSTFLQEDEFFDIIFSDLFLRKVLLNQFVITDFPRFSTILDSVFDEVNSDHSGTVAQYIPQLASIDPDQFGMGICTVDGQRYSSGEADVPFCIQSCSKPITYCSILKQHGVRHVHQHIGREPSGRGFNERVLTAEGWAHNPMINAGAIMSVSLFHPELNEDERFDKLIKIWKKLSASDHVTFNNSVYLSEKATADRNHALGYMMKESGAFHHDVNLKETLELYFMQCSIELTCNMMSVVAATFANGGVNPLTNKRIFEPSVVRYMLSLLFSAGMYDASGEFAFKVGFPTKSGVSGVIMMVIPGKMGICTWSPRLDSVGNSVRGVSFCNALLRMFDLHIYSNIQFRPPTPLHYEYLKKLHRYVIFLNQEVKKQKQRVNTIGWDGNRLGYSDPTTTAHTTADPTTSTAIVDSNDPTNPINQLSRILDHISSISTSSPPTLVSIQHSLIVAVFLNDVSLYSQSIALLAALDFTKTTSSLDSFDSQSIDIDPTSPHNLDEESTTIPKKPKNASWMNFFTSNGGLSDETLDFSRSILDTVSYDGFKLIEIAAIMGHVELVHLLLVDGVETAHFDFQKVMSMGFYLEKNNTTMTDTMAQTTDHNDYELLISGSSNGGTKNNGSSDQGSSAHSTMIGNYIVNANNHASSRRGVFESKSVTNSVNHFPGTKGHQTLPPTPTILPTQQKQPQVGSIEAFVSPLQSNPVTGQVPVQNIKPTPPKPHVILPTSDTTTTSSENTNSSLLQTLTSFSTDTTLLLANCLYHRRVLCCELIKLSKIHQETSPSTFRLHFDSMNPLQLPHPSTYIDKQTNQHKNDQSDDNNYEQQNLYDNDNNNNNNNNGENENQPSTKQLNDVDVAIHKVELRQEFWDTFKAQVTEERGNNNTTPSHNEHHLPHSIHSPNFNQQQQQHPQTSIVYASSALRPDGNMVIKPVSYRQQLAISQLLPQENLLHKSSTSPNKSSHKFGNYDNIHGYDINPPDLTGNELHNFVAALAVDKNNPSRYTFFSKPPTWLNALVASFDGEGLHSVDATRLCARVLSLGYSSSICDLIVNAVDHFVLKENITCSSLSPPSSSHRHNHSHHQQHHKQNRHNSHRSQPKQQQQQQQQQQQHQQLNKNTSLDDIDDDHSSSSSSSSRHVTSKQNDTTPMAGCDERGEIVGVNDYSDDHHQGELNSLDEPLPNPSNFLTFDDHDDRTNFLDQHYDYDNHEDVSSISTKSSHHDPIIRFTAATTRGCFCHRFTSLLAQPKYAPIALTQPFLQAWDTHSCQGCKNHRPNFQNIKRNAATGVEDSNQQKSQTSTFSHSSSANSSCTSSCEHTADNTPAQSYTSECSSDHHIHQQQQQKKTLTHQVYNEIQSLALNLFPFHTQYRLVPAPKQHPLFDYTSHSMSQSNNHLQHHQQNQVGSDNDVHRHYGSNNHNAHANNNSSRNINNPTFNPLTGQFNNNHSSLSHHAIGGIEGMNNSSFVMANKNHNNNINNNNNDKTTVGPTTQQQTSQQSHPHLIISARISYTSFARLLVQLPLLFLIITKLVAIPNWSNFVHTVNCIGTIVAREELRALQYLQCSIYFNVELDDVHRYLEENKIDANELFRQGNQVVHGGNTNNQQSGPGVDNQHNKNLQSGHRLTYNPRHADNNNPQQSPFLPHHSQANTNHIITQQQRDFSPPTFDPNPMINPNHTTAMVEQYDDGIGELHHLDESFPLSYLIPSFPFIQQQNNNHDHNRNQHSSRNKNQTHVTSHGSSSHVSHSHSKNHSHHHLNLYQQQHYHHYHHGQNSFGNNNNNNQNANIVQPNKFLDLPPSSINHLYIPCFSGVTSRPITELDPDTNMAVFYDPFNTTLGDNNHTNGNNQQLQYQKGNNYDMTQQQQPSGDNESVEFYRHLPLAEHVSTAIYAFEDNSADHYHQHPHHNHRGSKNDLKKNSKSHKKKKLSKHQQKKRYSNTMAPNYSDYTSSDDDSGSELSNPPSTTSQGHWFPVTSPGRPSLGHHSTGSSKNQLAARVKNFPFSSSLGDNTTNDNTPASLRTYDYEACTSLILEPKLRNNAKICPDSLRAFREREKITQKLKLDRKVVKNLIRAGINPESEAEKAKKLVESTNNGGGHGEGQAATVKTKKTLANRRLASLLDNHIKLYRNQLVPDQPINHPSSVHGSTSCTINTNTNTNKTLQTPTLLNLPTQSLYGVNPATQIGNTINTNGVPGMMYNNNNKNDRSLMSPKVQEPQLLSQFTPANPKQPNTNPRPVLLIDPPQLTGIYGTNGVYSNTNSPMFNNNQTTQGPSTQNQISTSQQQHQQTPILPSLPSQFGLAITTATGQTTMFGANKEEAYCVQSLFKVINYCIVQELFGEEEVHHYVGREPSGRDMGDLSLDHHSLPHNPYINSGAISVCALLLLPDLTMSQCFDLILSFVRRLTGHSGHVTYNIPHYLNEKEESDKNYCLAFMIKDSNKFPPHIRTHRDVDSILDLYALCSAIELTRTQISTIAATLANGGVNPLSGERIFSPRTVRNTLSIMSTCGVYNFAGEFSFHIGLPAKSSADGILMVCVPGLMGLAITSPILDENGLSILACRFMFRLSRIYSLHIYDSYDTASKKANPRDGEHHYAIQVIQTLCAAKKNDTYTMAKFFKQGIEPNVCDGFGRTPLHLAVENGSIGAVSSLLGAGALRSLTDINNQTAQTQFQNWVPPTASSTPPFITSSLIQQQSPQFPPQSSLLPSNHLSLMTSNNGLHGLDEQLLKSPGLHHHLHPSQQQHLQQHLQQPQQQTRHSPGLLNPNAILNQSSNQTAHNSSLHTLHLTPHKGNITDHTNSAQINSLTALGSPHGPNTNSNNHISNNNVGLTNSGSQNDLYHTQDLTDHVIIDHSEHHLQFHHIMDGDQIVNNNNNNNNNSAGHNVSLGHLNNVPITTTMELPHMLDSSTTAPTDNSGEHGPDPRVQACLELIMKH